MGRALRRTNGTTRKRDKPMSEGYPFDCPIGDCDGEFAFETIIDHADAEHSKIKTTCEHVLFPCEYCENAVQAENIVLSHPPEIGCGVRGPKSVLCVGCAKACRVYTLEGWG